MMSYDVKKETIKNMRNRTTRLEREGDYWDQAELDTLKREFGDGTGITEIALMLQRTEPAIMQQIEKIDLYDRKANPQRIRNKEKALECLCSKCNFRLLCIKEGCMMNEVAG